MPLNLRNTLINAAKKPSESDVSLFNIMLKGLVDIEMLANNNNLTLRQLKPGLLDACAGEIDRIEFKWLFFIFFMTSFFATDFLQSLRPQFDAKLMSGKVTAACAEARRALLQKDSTRTFNNPKSDLSTNPLRKRLKPTIIPASPDSSERRVDISHIIGNSSQRFVSSARSSTTSSTSATVGNSSQRFVSSARSSTTSSTSAHSWQLKSAVRQLSTLIHYKQHLRHSWQLKLAVRQLSTLIHTRL